MCYFGNSDDLFNQYRSWIYFIQANDIDTIALISFILNKLISAICEGCCSNYIRSYIMLWYRNIIILR